MDRWSLEALIGGLGPVPWTPRPPADAAARDPPRNASSCGREARPADRGYAWGMRRARIASLLLAALAVAACGTGTASDTPAPSVVATTPPAPSAVETQPTASHAVPASVAPSPSGAPVGTPEPSPVDTPSARASDVPSDAPTPSASATADTGPAAACSGSADNRAFYANLAASVSWDVYCAVLPRGWFVSAGSYRLANGGKLVISYKGPAGATLTLSEGAFCTDGSGCVPSGTESGPASFGAMDGTLVATDAGGYAIVVAKGENPSWLMTTGGLDQATTVALGQALARVGS